MSNKANFYVYAYFDPRNYEMFYVGKGQGSRKYARAQPDKAGKLTERRIHEIERAGLKPLIRIIAADLTEDQAFLVEKALIWRNAAWLTNVSPGHFSDNFRPPNTLHVSLPGFDTARGIYFANVGDNPHRIWEDCRKYGFLAAGYGRQFSSQLDRLEVGSIAAAYLRGSGFVGVARVVETAIPVREFRHKGKALRPKMLEGPELFHDEEDDEDCEYLVALKWIKHLPRDKARFRSKVGLYTPRLIVASLSNQPKTLKFLEQEFKVKFETLLAAE
jgi:hypothetical protein